MLRKIDSKDSLCYSVLFGKNIFDKVINLFHRRLIKNRLIKCVPSVWLSTLVLLVATAKFLAVQASTSIGHICLPCQSASLVLCQPLMLLLKWIFCKLRRFQRSTFILYLWSALNPV
jgi:hypothetical protein